jgi:hypothetical protein
MTDSTASITKHPPSLVLNTAYSLLTRPPETWSPTSRGSNMLLGHYKHCRQTRDAV